MSKNIFGKKIDPEKMEARMRAQATREIKGAAFAAAFVLATIGIVFGVAKYQRSEAPENGGTTTIPKTRAPGVK